MSEHDPAADSVARGIALDRQRRLQRGCSSASALGCGTLVLAGVAFALLAVYADSFGLGFIALTLIILTGWVVVPAIVRRRSTP